MEIEVKVIEIDKKEIIRKLKSLKAKKLFEGEIENFIFENKDLNLLQKNLILRVRKKENECILTLKEKIDNKNLKIAKETELKIEDCQKMIYILKKLGFEIIEHIKKKRTTFKLDNCFIEIEEIKDIPTFLEIECKNKKDIEKIIKRLNVPNKKVKNWNTKELLNYYKKS